MAVYRLEARALLLAAVPWLLLVVIVLAGFKTFEITDQAWDLWNRRYTPYHVFSGGHPHALRYLLYWPILELGVLLGITGDQAFTLVSMIVLLGTIAVMVRCEHLLSSGSGTQSRLRAASYGALLVLLALAMNGRLIYPFAGYALVICAALDFLINGRWSLPHLAALTAGGFLSSVSSGTIAVVALFVALFVFWTWLTQPRSSAAVRLWSSAALFMILFFGPAIAGLYRNLEFFGGGLSGAVNMLSHGLGRVFLKFGLMGLAALAVLAIIGLICFWFLYRRQSGTSFALTLALVPAAIGGLFGLSTLATGLIPLMLALRLQSVTELFGASSAIVLRAVMVAAAGSAAALGVVALLLTKPIATTPAAPPDPRTPSIVVGLGITEGSRPVSEAKFTYPEAAVAQDGTIYVANALGGTVEAIADGTITTLYAGEGSFVPNDLEVGPEGLFVLDQGTGSIRLISSDGAQPSDPISIPKFTDEADFFGASSLDIGDDGYLVSGTPVVRAPGGGVLGTGRSLLVELQFDSDEWSVLAEAADIAGLGATFRDASYNRDGSIAVLVGEFFAVIGQGGEIRKVPIGVVHGGGILETDGGWLLGTYTSVSHVSRDFEVSTYPLPMGFANVGDIRRTEAGALLITDTDRQVVYRVETAAAKKPAVTAIGGGQSLKITDLDVAPDGRLLLLENASPRILAYEPESGNVSVIAGSGRQSRSYGNSSADKYSFYFPSGLAAAPDGSIFVSEANYRIVRVKDGRAEIFAGDVNGGVPTEGQPRLEARFGALRGLDVDNKGRLLIVDRGNHTIWRIAGNGVVEHVMGTGESGKWVEGEPADTQPLNSPMDVLAREDGSILVTDTYNNAIVEIDPQGLVRRFAGIPTTLHYQGFGGYSGDGGSALNAEFNTPWRLSEGADGSVYVVDQFNHAVRRIAPDGTITTVLGGSLGNSQDGSRMNLPGAALVLGGFLYVADTGNSVVRAKPLEFGAD